MKRVIFDLDGTLMNANYDDEKRFFLKKLGNTDKAQDFILNIGDLLHEYERGHFSYDVFALTKFMQKKGYDFTEDTVLSWVKFFEGSIRDEICPGVIELLDLCKSKGIKMSVATNWFTEAQTGRLRRAGLLDYFDVVVGGDYFLKPGKTNFYLAANGTPYEECVVIGNNYMDDYIGAINADMKAILLNDHFTINDIMKKINNKNKVYVKEK